MKKFPWFDNQEEIEKRNFRLRPVPDSDRWLLTPSADKHKWEEEELNWRSSLLNNEGYEISGGLPKFKNYGEDRNEVGEYSKIDKEIAHSVQNGTALLTLKADGSLIIRSVYENKVILRTRGSYELPNVEGTVNFQENVYKLVEEKYPCLLNPSILPNLDLYFEYISPENKIVVSYIESDLIFIHAKYRETQQLLTWQNLKELAAAYKLNLVPLMEFKVNNPVELKQQIDDLEKQGLWPHEGIVIRTLDGLMSKIKGEEYLYQHKLKSGFNYKKMVAICEDQNIKDYQNLKKFLQEELVLDWETIYELEDMFQMYLERRKQYENVLQPILDFVNNWEPVGEENIQKQFALAVKGFPNIAVYFYFYNHNQDVKIEEAPEEKSVMEKLFKQIVIKGEN